MINEQAIKEKREQGYKNGLTWPDAWETHGEPGGPFIYGNSYNRNDDLRAQSVAENAAWREGWKNGHAEKLRTGRSNPNTKDRE